MAISYIGGAQNAGAANPLTGEFTVHANTAAGDLVIAQWYSRASAKTFTNTDAINILIDQATANGGHLVVGWWIAGSNADSKTWDGSSVSNGTTGWQTATFRGPNSSAPFRYSGSVAGGSNQIPNAPSISTGNGDSLVAGFGGMDDYGTVTQPALFTTAGTWESTLGTDASAGMSYDLDGGTGSAVDPAAYGTTFTAATYWYAWTGSLDPSVAPTPVSQTLTPAYDVRNVVAQTLTPTYDLRQLVAQSLGGAGGGGSLTVYSTAEGNLYSSIAVYADARDDAPPASLLQSDRVQPGQLLSAGLYRVFESLLQFDTSAIPDAATITAVTFSVWPTTNATTQDFEMELWTGWDYGASVDVADWLPISTVVGGTKLATLDTTSIATGSYQALTSLASIQAAINRAGTTFFALVSSRATAGSGTAPTANTEYVTCSIAADQHPRLVIEYTTAAPVTYDVLNTVAQTLTPVYDVQQSLAQVSTTLTPTYNVIQHVAGSLTPAYNVRNLVAQTLTPAYDLRQLAAQTLTPQYGVRQVVTQSLTPVYGVVQHVSATITPEYDMSGPSTAVSQTLTPVYGVRQLAAQTLSPTYSVRSLVHQTLTPAYSVIQHVAQTLAAAYSVTQLAAQTLAPTYSVIQHVSATLTPAYNVTQGVNQTLTPVYGVRSLTSRTLTPVYDLRIVVAQAIEPAYGVRQIVSQTITPEYGVIQHVNQTLSATYNLIQRVSQTLEPMYGILEAGLTQVSQTLTPTYDLVQHTPQTLTLGYTIRVLVAQALQPGYNVRTLAAGMLTPVYSVRASVSASMTPGYNLRELAGAVLSPTYDLAELRTATLTPTYSILADLSAVDQTFEALYDLRELAVQTLTSVYGIIQHSDQTLTVTYHILGYSKYDHAIVAPRRWPLGSTRRNRPRPSTPVAPGKWYRRR